MLIAIKDGDGELAVSYLSSSFIEEMEVTLNGVRANPNAVSLLASVGIYVTNEDLETMNVYEYSALVLESPLFGLTELYEVETSNVSIDGETAIVEVTILILGGVSETPMTFLLVLEDGEWKITELGGETE